MPIFEDDNEEMGYTLWFPASDVMDESENKEQRERTYELHNFAMERNLRIDTSNANGQLIYKYKSTMVMSIGIERTYMRFLDVCVIGKDRADEHTIIEENLEKESRDFQNEALKRMSGCDLNQCVACSTYSSGNFVTIMGKNIKCVVDMSLNFNGANLSPQIWR